MLLSAGPGWAGEREYVCVCVCVYVFLVPFSTRRDWQSVLRWAVVFHYSFFFFSQILQSERRMHFSIRHLYCACLDVQQNTSLPLRRHANPHSPGARACEQAAAPEEEGTGEEETGETAKRRRDKGE